MTMYPRRSPTVFDPNADIAINLVPSQDQPEAVGRGFMGDTLAAAFRQENVIGSLLARQWESNEPVEGYAAWDDIKGTKYEELWDRFTVSNNPGYTAALKRQIDMEEEDRRTLHAAGGWGMLASIGAGIFSPENLLPGGTIVRGVRIGSAVGRTAMSTASAAAIAVAGAEGVLHESQELRTPLESAFNIGGAAVLGGMLGAGLSAAFSKAEWVRLGKAVEKELAAGADPVALAKAEVEMLSGMGSDVGAAARTVETLDDLTIAGKAAQAVGGATRFLNPVLRVLHSSSRAVRSIGVRLFENPVYLKKNMEGQTPGHAVETLVKEYTQGAMARAVDEANKLFGDYRKGGGALNRKQWNQAIGRAMRRNDEDADPSIAAGAKAWRAAVFDPLKEKAIEAGLLPKDVSVDTALSYFTRVYNRPMIEAREAEFKAIVKRYIDREVRNAESRAAMAKLDPKVEPPSREPVEFLNDKDRAAYVDQITDDIFNTITGRNVDGDIPRDIVAATRGPLKERTFHIPDEEIEEFLESNVEAVGRRYARTMAADIELTQAFGKADLKEQISQIRADYQRLREAVEKNVDPETGAELKKPLDKAAKEKAIKRLTDAEKHDIRDIEALRDMIRGTYLARENATNFARAARVAGTVNYIRLLGGVTLTSLTEVARHFMVHGLSGVMLDGLVPLMRNLKGFKMSVEEGKIAGAVTERLLNTRMATWADINDPYSVGSPFERFMDNTAAGFSRLNGLVYWTDFQNAFASVVTQNRVLRGTGNYAGLGKREKAYLAFLGIDEGMAARIQRQFDQHGSVESGGIRVAHTDDWTDEVARRTYRAAINKDVDSIVVKKGIGDVPLFAHTPTGRLLLQFKGFAMASHQRALMRGLQERPMGFVAGAMTATTIGMLVYYLKSIEANRTEDISDNPGRWIAEGLDRSGLFTVAFEANNTIEKAFGIGAYGALAKLFPGSDQDGKASRYASRGFVEGLLGPTAALIDNAWKAGNAIKGEGGWSEGEIRNLYRLAPGATLPGIRSLVEYVGVPAAVDALN
jgi:hypothetical protein